MNLFDFIIIFVFATSAIFGLLSGFVSSLLRIIQSIVIILALIFLFPEVKIIASEHVQSSMGIALSSMLISYVLSKIFSSVIFKWLNDFCVGVLPSAIDKPLGFILGGARGFVLSMSLFVITAIITSTSYVSSKNLWELVTKFDNKYYPNWFKSAYLFEDIHSIHGKLIHTLENGFISQKCIEFKINTNKNETPENDKESQDRNSDMVQTNTAKINVDHDELSNQINDLFQD